MSGDHAAVAAQRFTAARAGTGSERAAAGAVLEAAGIAAADELSHAGTARRVTARRGSAASRPGTRRLRRVTFAERLTHMPARSFWAILTLTLPAFACGGSGVRYSGESRTPRVEPAGLAASDGPPPGHHRLGEVTAACSRVDAEGGLDGERPGDVACSPELLLAGLRERAARAGGSVLVGVACEPEGAANARHVECSAEVWAPSAQPGQEAPALPVLGAALTPAFGVVEDFWRVELDYWPAVGVPPRAPVGLEQVSEIDLPRMGHVRLGDMRARAATSVSAGTLRSALLAGAARVGATRVVGVQCIEGGGDRLCVASVSALGVVEGALAGNVAGSEPTAARP